VNQAEVLDGQVRQPRKGEVFGPLIEREGVTLLPVVRVRRWGSPRAVGAWVVRDGRADWQPAFDLTRVIVTGNALGLVALIVFRPRISRPTTARGDG
jgi:hypothetical protein